MVNFPHDLVFDVLSRLPVNSVLRFRCICKSWCSLISEPQFVKTHLNRAITNLSVGCQRVLIHGKDNKFESIDYEAQQLLSEKELEEALRNNGGNACTVLDFPWSGRDHRVEFVGSCHGMLCVVVDRNKIILCNPCTREYRELPKPTSINMKYEYSIHGGLGYDSYVDDYKFVIVVRDRNNDKEFKAEVFSLRSNSWRIIQDIPPDIFYTYGCERDNFFIYGCERGVFLNGGLHWIAIVKTRGPQIISFDLATEKFQKPLPLPPDQGDKRRSYNHYSNLIILGGCLSVSNRFSRKTHVWVMKEYGVEASWTKLCSLNIRIYGPMHHYLRPVCLSKNGELLVDVDDKIIIYNPQNQNYRKLYRSPWWINRVVQYSESLVSPNVRLERISSTSNNSQRKKTKKSRNET